jgi:hypothetical protein
VRIFIVGVRHQIQPAEIKVWSSSGRLQAFEREQKQHFASLLQDSIAANGVQIVAEETVHGEDTVTTRVCASANCRYANIEMPPDERNARGIPAGYNENPDIPSSDREQWNREGEEYMAEKTIAEAAEAESVMVVCGWSHMEALVERFENGGHTVEMTDLQNQPWYIDNWMENMRRL